MNTHQPTLVVVSGPPGSGKTTLARQLALELTCPAVCRDEIKEGLVRSVAGYSPKLGDDLDERTFEAFFATVHVLLEHGVTVVAEAAFQDHVWSPRLAALAGLSELRVVQCYTEPAVALQRISSRSRSAHADAELLAHGDNYFTHFRRLSSTAPTIDVDTTDGYDPPFEEIVTFVSR